VIDRLVTVRNTRATLGAVVSGGGDQQRAAIVIERLFAELHEALTAIRAGLEGVEHPLARRAGPASLAAAVVPRTPDANDPGDLFALGEEALHEGYDAWFRLLGRLAWIAEQAELAAGFDPMLGGPPATPAKP
jgi:hypothetical protein